MSLVDRFFEALESVKPENDKVVALATADPAYAGGKTVRVTFDGETVLTTKAYPVSGAVTPGSRVVMLRVGKSWVVMGSVEGSSGWTLLSDLGWQNGHGDYDYGGSPKFRKVDGIVSVQGLITKAASAGHHVTMPVGFRPKVNLIWSAATSSGPMECRLETSGSFFFNNASAAAWASVAVTYAAA